MLEGAKNPSELVTMDQEAEAYFFAGEHYLLIQDTGNAQKMFLECVSKKRHYAVEDAGARAELLGLKK
jgi:hypothetical protein